jgi:RNA polymerase sigma-70 factor (ECF subfamily)
VDSSASQLSPNTRRILAAIENLPGEEREVFNLVRIQGMTQPDAAAVLGVSAKTVQRRLNRSRLLLAEQLEDLHPPPGDAPGGARENAQGSAQRERVTAPVKLGESVK